MEVNLSSQNHMIRVPLTLHSPEAIYHHLRVNVGPLYMAIRNNQAIITFPNPEHTQIALHKFQNAVLNNMRLQLFPYQEGDIEPHPQKPSRPEKSLPATSNNSEALPSHTKEINTGPQLSDLTILVEEMLKVRDPNDVIEVVTKQSKEDLVKFISSYTPLADTMSRKREAILKENVDESTRAAKIRELQRFYKKSLKEIADRLRESFRALRCKCSKFGELEKVNLDPSIQISLPSKPRPSESFSYRLNIEHINSQFFGLKRVAALNDHQFLCTSHQTPNSSLLVFQTDEQYIQLSTSVNEGAYGLCVLDQHILVGTNDGHLAIYTTPELSQYELSLRLHHGMIFDVVKQSNRSRGYNLMMLGNDNLLSLWSVENVVVAPEVSTLIFEKSASIAHDKHMINSVVAFEQSSRIAYSLGSDIMLYDCSRAQSEGKIQGKGDIIKLAVLDQNTLAVANERFLSIVDTRNNANTLNLQITRKDKELRTVAPLGPHFIFYGCYEGQVGHVDTRYPLNDGKTWSNRTSHKGKVYDICRVGETVVSIDHLGQVISWLPHSGNQSSHQGDKAMCVE